MAKWMYRAKTFSIFKRYMRAN